MEQEYINSGILNATKVKKNPKSPDYWGDILLDLKELGIGNGKHKMKLSGWKKISKKNGNTFLSLRIAPFTEEDNSYSTKKPQQSQPQSDEDDPF